MWGGSLTWLGVGEPRLHRQDTEAQEARGLAQVTEVPTQGPQHQPRKDREEPMAPMSPTLAGEGGELWPRPGASGYSHLQAKLTEAATQCVSQHRFPPNAKPVSRLPRRARGGVEGRGGRPQKGWSLGSDLRGSPGGTGSELWGVGHTAPSC